jgi:cytochrome c-type biogenesis protein
MLANASLLNISVDANIFLICGVIFLTGFLSGLSPCSLPTVALVVGYVSGKKNEKKSHGFIISLFFTLGIAITLTILGLFAGSLGNLLIKSKVLTYIIAAVLIFIGLWMLKLFNIGKGSLMEKMHVKKQSGVLGAFLLGLPFGIAASPCTMPVTIAVLAFAAAKGSIIYGMLFMFIFAIGRSIPIIIAGTFTGFLKKAKFLNKYEKVFEIIGDVLLVLIGFISSIKGK